MTNVELLNKTEANFLDGGYTTIDLVDLPYFDDESYDFLDEKDFSKYISDLETIVRRSFEYRQLIAYLRNTEGMDECAFLENVSAKDNAKVRIEIHHAPLTLYDICLSVFRKRQKNGEDLEIEMVAEEVMYCHYAGIVGLIPLSESVHKMVHNQYLAVPTNVIRGNYMAFVNAYYNSIEPDVLDCLDALELWTKEYDGKQMELFNDHKIYINNMSNPKNGNEVIRQSLKGKVAEIKNEQPVRKQMVRVVSKT